MFEQRCPLFAWLTKRVFLQILNIVMIGSILQCGEVESLSLEKFELLLNAHQDYIVSRLTDHFAPILQEFRDVAHVSPGFGVCPEPQDVHTLEPMRQIKKEVPFVPGGNHFPLETMKVWAQTGPRGGQSPPFDVPDDYPDSVAIQDSMGLGTVTWTLSPSFSCSASPCRRLSELSSHSQSRLSKCRGLSESSALGGSIARSSVCSMDSAECCDEGLPMTLPPNWPTVPQRSGLEDSSWSMKSVTYLFGGSIALGLTGTLLCLVCSIRVGEAR